MKKRMLSLLLAMALVATMIPGTLQAKAEDTYTTLSADSTLELTGETLWVDLKGYDLNITGTGTVYAFDSANDGYDAAKCGKITAPATVTVESDVEAPNGSRYVAVTENDQTTMHRLSMSLTTVTLNITKMGISYKAVYYCDEVLSSKVDSYGVVLSLSNMPGADFKTEVELYSNQYTVAADPFQSGAVCVSGTVKNIMKDTNTADINNSNGNCTIYANAYIDFGNGPLVADTVNPGKTLRDADFTGVAHSLRTTMDLLDEVYYTKLDEQARNAANAFYTQWKDKGMDWAFENIGKAHSLNVDNSNLQFEEGTTNAICPVCQEKVTWTAVGKESGTVYLGGKHYYLTKNLTFTGESDSGYITNASAGTTACLHLNGHNITATETRAIFGSSGRLNVMGNGTVSGYNKAAQGAAVQINNYTAGNGVYLYGGTYQKTDNTRADAHTVAIWHNGTTMNIFGGAKVIGSGTGAAVYSSRCSYADNTIGLYGCTIQGDVRLNGATEQNGKTSTVIMNGATVTGTVNIPLHASGSVSGEAKIQQINIHTDSRLTVGVLKGAAQIGIRAENVFTNDNAAIYRQYFTPVSPAAQITVDGTALRCGIDYTGKLQFAEGTTDAVCPVCEKVVTWTALPDNTKVTAAAGSHYYLTGHVTYDYKTGGTYRYIGGPDAGGTACIHLNGFNITSNTRAFYGNGGVLNVMGSGIVTGEVDTASLNYGNGAAVQMSRGNKEAVVNLYGGTYRNGGNADASAYVISLFDNGGEINIYEGATVEGSVYTGTSNQRNSLLTVKGTVTGDVYAKGAASDAHTSTLTFDNGAVLGTVDLNGAVTVNVLHAPKLSLVDMEETTRLTMDRLQTGASITVSNTGVLTEPHAEAETFMQYFHTPYATDKLLVKDNCIVYKMNYTDNLVLTDEGMGFCPVCKKDVLWSPISSDSAYIAFNTTGSYTGTHYYLTKSLTYSGSATAFIQNSGVNHPVCLHLNGHNITSTTVPAFFGSNGAMNIMGTGTVSGYNNSGSANKGSAIFTNNGYTNNGFALYSGKYTMQSNAVASSVISLWANGGRIHVHEDATIDANGGLAVFTSTAKNRTNDLQVLGATVKGDIVTTANPTKTSTLLLCDANITGTVTAAAGNGITFAGLAKVGKLSVPAGVTVSFTDMKAGSCVPVSADGIFTDALADDAWLDYFSTSDEGDWLILRDHAVCQSAMVTIATAGDAEKTALDAAYAGRQPLHGEMHDHTSSGNYGDGKNTLAQWITEMDRLSIDFATIVDHHQSSHMYLPDWDNSRFVGGSEPGTTVSDSKATNKTFHFNMIFSDPKALEEAFAFGGYTLVDDGVGGKEFKDYVGFKVSTFTELTKKVYELGGLLVHVHPKYNSYMVSDDPLDYYFGGTDVPMGLEITTGSGGNMAYRDNEEAYQLWVDLLEAGKWVYATAGSDKHALPNPSALTTLYSAERKASTYMRLMRSGDFAPGWVGIRMQMGDVTMGGRTDFTGKKLVFSVGDMYTGDKNEANPVYVANHTYRVELYDDKGILSQCVIDPTQTTYFAIDADESARFYRVVVWDDTAETRVGVSNPIWNTK